MSGRRSRRTRISIVVALLVILVAGVYLFTRDDPPPDDAHLRITYENIPSEENAFTYFDEAAETLDWPESGEEKQRAEALLDEDGWDEAFATELLARNEGVLELIDRGLACPHFQVPEIKDYETSLPHLAPWRHIAWLGAIRAELLFAQDKQQEAFEQAMQVIRLGRRIQDARGCMVHCLVGTAVKEIGLQQFRSMLGRTTLAPGALMPTIDQLASCGASAEGFADALRIEYTMTANLIEGIARGKIDSGLPRLVGPNPFTFKPNRTKRVFASAYSMVIDNAGRTYADCEFPDPPTHPSGWQSTAEEIASGNYVGKIIYRLLMPAFSRFQGSKCRDNCSVAVTQVMIALKCYQLEHGDLPDTLDELVPDYLDAVPLDDFDGKPIRYSKEERIVYSIDRNLVDDGGTSYEDCAGSDSYDWVYKIPF